MDPTVQNVDNLDVLPSFSSFSLQSGVYEGTMGFIQPQTDKNTK